MANRNIIADARPNGEVGSWTYKIPNDERVPLYTFNLERLQQNYDSFISYSDEVFIEELPAIIHFACIVSYYKGLSPEETLIDNGIIHNLVHLLHHAHGGLTFGLYSTKQEEIESTRKQFNKLLKI